MEWKIRCEEADFDVEWRVIGSWLMNDLLVLKNLIQRKLYFDILESDGRK